MSKLGLVFGPSVSLAFSKSPRKLLAKAIFLLLGNLKDFYLGTPMLPLDYAYMHIPVTVLPPDIMDHYDLHGLIHDGHVYVEIQCGMYACHKLVRLLMTRSNSSCSLMATTHTPLILASGNMTPATSTSPWLLVIFPCVTPTMMMPPISWLCSMAITKSPKIGKLTNIAVSLCYDWCTMDISMPGYIEHATYTPSDPNMHHILGSNQPMVQKSNTPWILTTWVHLMLLTVNTFRRASVFSSTMHSHAVDPLCLFPLAPLPPSSMEPKLPCRPSQICSIITPPIQMLSLISMPVTWSCGCTAMCPTLWCPKPICMLLDTPSWALSPLPLCSTATDPALPDNGPVHVLCQIRQYLVLQRQNWESHSSMLKPSAPFPLPWKNWATCNQPHLCKLTTTWPMGLSMILSSKNDPKLWTCASTGFVITSDKARFTSFGAQAPPTKLITSQNTTPHPIYACLSDPLDQSWWGCVDSLSQLGAVTITAVVTGDLLWPTT